MKLLHENGRSLALIDDLKPWSDNPRTISDEKLHQLIQDIKDVESIDPETDGQFKPLIITRDGVVVGGNMRLKAYKSLGKTKLWVSMVNTTDPKEAFRIAIRDNMKYGEYSEDMLEQTLEKLELEQIDIEGLEVDFGEVTALSDLLRDEADDENDKADETPEVDDSPATSRVGKVYQLGRHRLMCGSATESADVEKLMDGKKVDMVFTDPPYGMFLDTNYSTMHKANDMGKGGKDYDKVIGDNDDFDPEFINVPLTRFADAKEIFMWGADYYKDYIPSGGSWVVWDKRANESGMDLDKLLGSAFELCWSRKPHKRDIARILWSGHHGMQKDDTKTRVHPTQKPVELVTWFFSRWGKEVVTVVDLFGGSGSTLIACEKTDRICFMMELDPKYVDTIRKRYHIYTTGSEDGWQKATKEVAT